MLSLKSSAHIPTNRHTRSFRSCRTGTGLPMRHVETRREYRQWTGLVNKQLHRLWIEEQWNEHFERAAGPLRILPPSARSQQPRLN